MHPFFSLFGKTIPAYGVMAVLGFVLGLAYVLFMAKPRGLDRENAAYIFCMGGIGALVGAKLLFLLLSLPSLISDLHLITSDPALFSARYLSGGMVYYGGLLGALTAAYRTAKSYRVEFSDYGRVLIPAAVIMAGVGRIGCFMAGCCYGVETDLPIGVVFGETGLAPHGVSLIPVQLMEAAFDLGIALALTVMAGRPERSKQILPVFLLSYASMRFLIEFFRGDEARGHLGPLSTSQVLSIAVAAATLIYLAVRRGRTEEVKIDEQKE